MPASDMIPHDDFAEGFKVGYQLIRGINAAIPGIPKGPATPENTTRFLVGIRVGIKAAGGWRDAFVGSLQPPRT